MRVRPGKLITSDRKPAVFWTQNPFNSYVSNTAVGSTKGYGFEFKIPHRTMHIGPLGGMIDLQALPVLKFEDNIAHSNAQAGLRVYRLNDSLAGDESQFVRLRCGAIGT